LIAYQQVENQHLHLIVLEALQPLLPPAGAHLVAPWSLLALFPGLEVQVLIAELE
jgi:hypothetical protein